MDNKLVLTVLFVTLSWISVGTYAQETTTTAPSTNMTTAANTTIAPTNATTAANTTVAPANATTAANTTVAPTNATTAANTTVATTNVTTAANTTVATTNVTTAANTTVATTNATTAANTTVATTNATTAANTTVAPNNATTAANTTIAPANATTAANTTVAPANATTAANTTVAPANATTAANMTVAPANATTAANTTAAPANATSAPNATTPVATTAPPLTQNTTVETLNTNVSRTGCGTTVLCAAQPAQCDPSTAGSCFFLNARRTSGDNFEFALAGEADGYIAATLSTDTTLGGNDTTYVCANNNSVVQFFATVLNNGQLTVTPLNVNSVKGRVNGKQIQCTFAATVTAPARSRRDTRASGFSVAVSTGDFNSTTGALGNPIPKLQSPVVDLANPNATVTDILVANTTTSPNTTGHAITLRQSLTQAVLITVGVLSLTML